MNVENRLRWFGTTRARAGVVVDNLLLYVTGGLAYANFRRNYTYFQDGPAHANVFSSNNTKLGWAAGAGAEWAFANNWTLKGEFLYMSFEQDRLTAAGDGNGIGNAGFSYRLDSQELGLGQPHRPELSLRRFRQGPGGREDIDREN